MDDEVIDFSEKKSVSFVKPLSDGKEKITETSDFFRIMQKGTEMIKLRGSSRHYNRLFYMNDKLSSILWYPTSKAKERAKIDIEEIKEVRLGCSDYASRALGRKINFSAETTIKSIQEYLDQNSELSRLQTLEIPTHQYKNNRPSNSKTTSMVVNMNMINSCAFTIVYGRNYESLELLTKNPTEANVWIIGLNRLVSNLNRGVTPSLNDKDHARNEWLIAEYKNIIEKYNRRKSKNEEEIDSLNENLVIQLATRLSRHLIPYRLKQYMKQIDLTKTPDLRGAYTQQDFLRIYKEATLRPDLYFIFANYATETDSLSVDDFANFLEVEQHMSTGAMKKSEEAIRKYEPNQSLREQLRLSIDGFTDYLLSAESSAFDPKHLEICQDMSQPLTHYFISSSNKAFTTDFQSINDLSILDSYQRGLMSGCRYIEIELFDGPGNVPLIGQNLDIPTNQKYDFSQKKSQTSSPSSSSNNHSLLIEVLDLIDKLAFVRSEFPLIISIENHLSLEQQASLAKILQMTFSDRLLTPKSGLTFRLEESQPTRFDFDRTTKISQVINVNLRKNENLTDKKTNQTNWPSPLDLVGKILLKGRRLPNDCRNDVGLITEENNGCLESEKFSKPQKLLRELSDLFFLDSTPYDGGILDDSRKASLGNSSSVFSNFKSKSLRDRKPLRSISDHESDPAYLSNDLVVIGSSNKNSISVNQSTNNTEGKTSQQHPYRMQTLTEDECLRYTYTSGASKLIKFSLQCMLRCSPSKMRSNLSNQNIFDSWILGTQIVPTNYQVSGLIMDLVTGFFGRNGACGYVLKPSVYRDSLSYFDPYDNNSQIPDANVQYMQIRIISAQQLPKPRGSGVKGDIIEPYVIVECHGVPGDCNEQRTKTLHGTAVYAGNCQFDDVLNFRVQIGSMAVLRFLVLDDDSISDDFIAQSCLPFDCIRPGYRQIRLRNELGEPLPYSSLFVHISITSSRNYVKATQTGLNMPKSLTTTLNDKSSFMDFIRNSAGRQKQKIQLRKITDNHLSAIFKKSTQYLMEFQEVEEAVYSSFDQFRRNCGDVNTFSVHAMLKNLASQMTSITGSNEPVSWPIKMLIRKEDSLPHMLWSPPSITPEEIRSNNNQIVGVDPDTISINSKGSIASGFQNMLKRRSLYSQQRGNNAETLSISSFDQHVSPTGQQQQQHGTLQHLGTLTKIPSMLSLNSLMSSSSMAFASTPAVRLERLKKTVDNFERFIEAAKTLIKKSTFIRDKLQSVQKEASNYFYQTMDNQRTQYDMFKGHLLTNERSVHRLSLGHSNSYPQTNKFSQQCSDNYVWNMRLITGTIQQLNLCLKEVNSWIGQAKDAANPDGIMNISQSKRQLYHQQSSTSQESLSISSSDRTSFSQNYNRSFEESRRSSPSVNRRLIKQTSLSLDSPSPQSSYLPMANTRSESANTYSQLKNGSTTNSSKIYTSMKHDTSYFIPKRSSLAAKTNSLDTRTYRPLGLNSNQNRFYKQ